MNSKMSYSSSLHWNVLLPPGAVITYDILSGWNPIRVYDQFLTDVLVSKGFLNIICVHHAVCYQTKANMSKFK